MICGKRATHSQSSVSNNKHKKHRKLFKLFKQYKRSLISLFLIWNTKSFAQTQTYSSLAKRQHNPTHTTWYTPPSQLHPHYLIYTPYQPHPHYLIYTPLPTPPPLFDIHPPPNSPPTLLDIYPPPNSPAAFIPPLRSKPCQATRTDCSTWSFCWCCPHCWVWN